MPENPILSMIFPSSATGRALFFDNPRTGDKILSGAGGVHKLQQTLPLKNRELRYILISSSDLFHA
jgi:hypothetical protein